MMLRTHELEVLRDALRAHGRRPSIVISSPRTSAELIDAMQIVEQWGPFVEAMYLMMAADRRVLNVEREVLRGALAVLSGDAVRTRHMEAMLDAASRNVTAEGVDRRFQEVVESLREDSVRAESAVVVAAAIAVADARVVPEEHAMLERLCKELEIADARAQEILAGMKAEVAAK